jgi:hypothetical protein
MDQTTKQIEVYYSKNKSGVIIGVIVILLLLFWIWHKNHPNAFCSNGSNSNTNNVSGAKVDPKQVDKIMTDMGSRMKQLQRQCDCDTECKIVRPPPSPAVNSQIIAQRRINNNILEV